MSVSAGTITLRRVEDALVRTIRRDGGVVGADLTNAGLFYAHNRGGRLFPGRIVFVPFDELFPF
jgi:hypothetical protein